LAMALDEPKENDLVVENDGIKFVIDENFANYFPAVNIDFRRSWVGKQFFIDTNSNGCSEGCC